MFAVVVATLSAAAAPAVAHAPHDRAIDIDFSPAYGSDQTVYVLVRSRLFRSTDGGATWTHVIRGLGGHTLQRVDIARSNPQVLYLSTITGGVFRSDDAGWSWAEANNGLPPLILEAAVSPVDSDVVLARGLSDLYRTTDGGQTWTLVPPMGAVVAFDFMNDGSGRAVVGTSVGKVRVSDDDGATWITTYTVPSAASITAVNANDNIGADGTVFVGTADGQVLVSADAAATFAAPGTGLPVQQAMAVTQSPDYANDNTIWATMRDVGAYRSADGGATWTPAHTGLTTDPQADTEGKPQFSEIDAAPDGAGGATLLIGGYDGLFRSDDGATSWQQIETLLEYPVGIAVSPNYAVDGTVALTTYVKGAYVSSDGGDTWANGHVGLGHPINLAGNDALPIRRLYDVVFSPDYASDNTLFTSTINRFAKSIDGGHSWTQITLTPSAPFPGKLVMDVSPDYGVDQTVFAGARDGSIYRSTAGGEQDTWSVIGSTGQRPRTVAVSPDYANDDELWVGSFDGVFRSTDEGATWTSTGLTGQAMIALSPDFASDDTVLAGTESGLFLSTDRGGTWTELVTGALDADSDIAAVEFSPDFANDQTVLASVENLGLLRSTDGAATFSIIATDLYQANQLIRDFSNPTAMPIDFSPAFAVDQTIFAYGKQDVFRSTDGGDSWDVLPIPPASAFYAPPVIAAAPTLATVTEGDSPDTVTMQIPFDLSHPYTTQVTADWLTLDIPSDPNLASSSGGDFVAASGTLVFEEGETRAFATVTIQGDELDEVDEVIAVRTHSPTNATIGGFFGLGFGLVTDDDPPPTLLPGWAPVIEGDAGTITLSVPMSLSQPSGRTVSVDWATIDLEATSGDDFADGSGTLTFLPGETSHDVDITVFGDIDVEPDEWLLIGTSNYVNAVAGGLYGLGFGLIQNDD